MSAASPRRFRRHLLAAVATLAAATVAGACASTDDPSAPPSDDASPRFAALATGPLAATTNPDDELRRVDREEVPGFAGFFVDDDGVLTVQLADTRRSAAAVAAVERRVNAPGQTGATAHRVGRVRAARYGFEQLATWRDTLRAGLSRDRLAAASLSFVDIDERLNRVALGYRPDAGPAALRRLVASLGVPESAVALVRRERRTFVTPALVACEAECGSGTVGTPATAATDLRSFQSPLVGGLQITYVKTASSATYGCSLTVVGRSALYGRLGIVTSSHCSASAMGTLDNTLFSQGGAAIAQKAIDPPFLASNSLPGADQRACVASYRCRVADAQFATLVSSRAVAPGYVALTASADDPFDPLRIARLTGIPVRAWQVPYQVPPSGSALFKVAATTGRTTSILAATCADIVYPGDVMLLCQYEGVPRLGQTNTLVSGGDSGGPVFSSWFGSPLLLGIVAGTEDVRGFMFSAWDAASHELGGVAVNAP